MKIYFDEDKNLIVEEATNGDIIGGQFRNFRGEKRQYNDAGKRNFNLRIPEDAVDNLVTAGLKIKSLGTEEDENLIFFVKVSIAYSDKYSPKVLTYTGDNIRELNENKIGELDSMIFDDVSLKIRTYRKDRDNPSCTLYLNTGIFKLHSDPIADKYEELLRSLNTSIEEVTSED